MSDARQENCAPVILLGDDVVNVLGVARNLGRLGIPVCRVGTGPNSLLSSRYISSHYDYPDLDDCPDAIYLDRIESAAQEFDQKPVIFPLSDIHVLRVSRNRDALGKIAFVGTPETSIVEKLVNKRRSYESMREFGLPHPNSRYPKSADEFVACSNEIGYPLFLKPEISPLFAKQFKGKGFVAKNESDVKAHFDTLMEVNVDVVAQEIIPGDATCMHGCAGVISDDAALTFCYRRVREFPAGFGCGSLLESVDDFSGQTRLLEYLRAIGYRGIFDAEFKRDPRDGVYKVIEINARSWWQNQLPTASGINIVFAAYKYAQGFELRPENYRAGATWMHLYNDFHASRSQGMGPGSWISGLRSVDCFDIWASDDKRPMLAFLGTMATGRIRKLFGIRR